VIALKVHNVNLKFSKRALDITIIIIIITITIIDVAISGDTNVIKKEAEKSLKYKGLTIDIQRMWNCESKVITLITGANRTISKSLRQYLSNVPGKHEIKKLQKKQPYSALYYVKC
jgi:hypothetical protein